MTKHSGLPPNNPNGLANLLRPSGAPRPPPRAGITLGELHAIIEATLALIGDDDFSEGHNNSGTGTNSPASSDSSDDSTGCGKKHHQGPPCQ